MTRVAVVTAGLSQPSASRMLADQLATAVAGKAGETTAETIELRSIATQLANNIVAGFPAGELSQAIETVLGADAVIAVTPIFNASYSGLFKMFFDVLDKDSLTAMPVLIGATGGSARHSLVLEHAIRPLFAYLHATVIPTAVYAATEDWGTAGLADRIDRAATELAAVLSKSAPRRSADPFTGIVPFDQLIGRQAPIS